MATQPVRYLHVISAQLDPVLFVGIGTAAYLLHERDYINAARQAAAASTLDPRLRRPIPIPLRELVVRK
ncbi:hypothetical protein HDU82_007290, partial [Entophlyctis luteolus]